jgi:hypothetical protein
MVIDRHGQVGAAGIEGASGIGCTIALVTRSGCADVADSAAAATPAQVRVPVMIQADADSFANHCGRCCRSSDIQMFTRRLLS